jgi:branched-chain amino acid transport system substrate-binding protein
MLALHELEGARTNRSHLQFDWQDNRGEPAVAATVMQKQYLSPPDIYVSGLKPQTMAIKPQIDAKGTPHFVWIFDASINQGTENNFRALVSYKIEPPVYLRYARHRQAKRVAIIYVYLPHAHEEFTQWVMPGLRQAGVSNILAEPYDLGVRDYKTIAVKVRDFGPDLIILNGFQHTLVGIIRAFRPLGLITDGNTIGTYDMIDTAEVLGKDENEGIRVVAPTFLTRPSKTFEDWKQRFKRRYGRDPFYAHAFAYDMAVVIDDAARRLSLPATSQPWTKAIRETKVPGVTGTLSFDKDGDLQIPLEIGVFRDGKLAPDKTITPGQEKEGHAKP